VLKQQHEHSCMTMHFDSSCKGMAISAIPLSWLEVLFLLLLAVSASKVETFVGLANGLRQFDYDRGRMMEELFQALRKVQTDRPDLIMAGVVLEEIQNIYRSFRRGAVMRAREVKVPKSIVGIE